MNIRKFIVFIAALLCSAAMFGQGLGASENLINWSQKVQKVEGDLAKVVFTGKIAEGYHTYTLDDEFSATEFMDVEVKGGEIVGEPYEVNTPKEEVDEFGDRAKHFYNEIILAVDIKVAEADAVFSGTIFTNSCTGGACKAEYYDFKVNLDVAPKTAISEAKPAEKDHSSANTWALVIEAIIWGFVMLLTPCVFPMVPMTVSFFLKGSSTPAQGRFKALMYGLFIVVLYTVPISLIIAITRIAGGDAVTADIFNWLATHWLPNTIFFVVFMVFAASFFGAFEITLPSSLVNKSDAGADKKGLAGIFFMALTLVLVSFSCTGPIVGTVLIRSTQGEFWTPMITMLAFSVAFALPFTVLALFPSLLKNLPKSGGWLNTVKVIMGFVEIAFGLKFLSVADQTYHWGLLDREVYLAIWIVVFTLLGLYILGKIRFAGDDKVEHLNVKRLVGAIAVFSFVVYMIPGMFGAPLSFLSGYLPPMHTQEFVIGAGSSTATSTTTSHSSEYGLSLPHGLQGYFTLEEGIEASKKEGKPIFVDITGHGCVNCREMESRVWSDPKVLNILKNDYIIVALYSDDKQKLPEDQWLHAENGDVYKDLGRKNSYIIRTKFNVNAQPNYALLDSKGELMVPVRGYNLDIDGFVSFLQSGLDAYKK
jgi:thiol:disulfide interchange protein DsbD